MSDIFSQRKRSAVMAAIRSHGNKSTELRLIQIFRAHGITGWRRGRKIRGPKTENGGPRRRFVVRPDFVFPKLPPSPRRRRTGKTAVFVDGCFWHGCPSHGTKPKTNAAFWRKKIQRNQARDKEVNRLLRAKGWKVVRVWEHELARKNLPRLLKRLASLRS